MRLIRATEILGLPVVTVEGGDHVASVDDVVLASDAKRVRAFTLDRGGLFSRSDGERLPLERVRAIGRDAIMIERAEEADAGETGSSADAGEDAKIISVDAVSETGDRLGTVRDVLIDTERDAEVVGFEIDGESDGTLLIREADAIAVSGDALVVSREAEAIEWDELGGFGSGLQSPKEAS